MLKWLAIVVMLFAVTQAPMPAIGQSPIPLVTAKSPESIHPQTETDKKTAADTQDSVTIIESNAMPSKKDWVDYTTLLVGIFITYITGAGVIAAWRGLPEFKRQAEAAKDAANAALFQAQTSVASERAWVVIRSSMKGFTPSSDELNYWWSIQNTGNTPARILETQCLYELLENTELYTLPSDPKYPLPIKLEGLLLPPERLLNSRQCLDLTEPILQREGDSSKKGLCGTIKNLRRCNGRCTTCGCMAM
jgi:hypothetical protein